MSESYFSHRNPAYLAQFFDYDPDTGNVLWKYDQGTRALAGQVAGVKNARGYIAIGFQGRKLAAHRVAWALHHGEWPPDHMQIDHANGDKADNRICNIRLCTATQNQWNRPKQRRDIATSHYIGVSYAGGGKYAASIKHGRKTIYLGRFDTAGEAALARDAAALHYRGEFAKLNFRYDGNLPEFDPDSTRL